jgi:hypothetical protein
MFYANLSSSVVVIERRIGSIYLSTLLGFDFDFPTSPFSQAAGAARLFPKSR